MEILKTAEELNPEYVVPKDYLKDQQRTIDSVEEFLEYRDSYSFDSKILIPLQPPYEKMAEKFSDFNRFLVGGVKNDPAGVHVKAVKKCRDLVGDEAYLHGLGMGSSLKFVKFVRRNPDVIDAVDVATPYHKTTSGGLIDKRCRPVDYSIAQGENTTTLEAQFINAMLLQLNFIYSDFLDDDEVLGSGGLSEYLSQ